MEHLNPPVLSRLRGFAFLSAVFLSLHSGAQFLALGQCETKSLIPVFKGDNIPSPANQKDPWQPRATSLPQKFVTATATLFEQGLADPRGMEYRQIRVLFGSVWGGAGVCTVHSWVLPSTPNQDQKFGVGWNGLVYPLVSVGEPANLTEDIRKTIKADEERRARYKIEHPSFPFYCFQPMLSDSSSMSEGMLLPLKACLRIRPTLAGRALVSHSECRSRQQRPMAGSRRIHCPAF